MGTAVTVTILLVLHSVYSIRVPTDWESASEVTHEKLVEAPNDNSDVVYESNSPTVPVPVEYFEYPAKKPQFAVDVAAFHGVPNPGEHFKANPVRPYTGKEKPELGKHKLLDSNHPVFDQFQKYTKINEKDDSYATPVSSDYEVFHPYKAEEPALQELYKDPVLDKIRNDIRNSQNRLQKYEKEAGQPDIQGDEYLESPEQTDRKKFPHRNVPVPYEIHRPQRRPVYYHPAPYNSRDHYLNQKFRHPWNQHNAKIRPVHYRPLKNHLQRLRQHHALTFDDEHNQYPQIPKPEEYAEVPDGYDIYERGKAKYVALRNNVDESINNAVKENRPTIYQRLELQNNGDRTETQISDDDEPEFVPIKNYAQVRKTETTKHLPRNAAFHDADSLDEIRNAPRLREAIKSTKAQTVYSEEGYEDAAFDHAGEEKHASENEGHGGYLKEKEISGGKYKTPSLSQKYQEADGNEYKSQNLHGEQWQDDDKDDEAESEAEDFSEDENEHTIEKDIYDDVTGERNKREPTSKEKQEVSSNEKEEEEETQNSEEAKVERSKRENKLDNETVRSDDIKNTTNTEVDKHEVNKRETKFKVPQININTTLLTADQFGKIAKLKSIPKRSNLKEKYPYYFKNLRNVHRDSPLRYSENLKLIPKKSNGGTAFYDSRSRILECPEVEDDVDAVPEKLKKEGHPDETESDDDNDDDTNSDDTKTKGEANFDQLKKNQRLKGLGDKIDCFKAKYFGENPLDSPFFKEDLIANPEPVTAPNHPVYKLSKDPFISAPSNNVFNISEKIQDNTKFDISELFDKLKGEQSNLQETLIKNNNELRASLLGPKNMSAISITPLSQQANVYTDVLENIKNNFNRPLLSGTLASKPILESVAVPDKNVTYDSFQNKEDITKSPPTVRKKRATPFVYEPYKIIRDGQVQESKKTASTSNISPLIRQLQSSRIVDSVTEVQPVKRNVQSRTYKDIGRRDREKNSKEVEAETTFVDVSVDKRRGEPRYEMKIRNHKPQYTPVENKKAMTVEDYEAQTNKTLLKSENKLSAQTSKVTSTTEQTQTRNRQNVIRQRRPTTARPFFDVSQFIPRAADTQRTSASTTVKKVVKRPVTTTESSNKASREESGESEEEDYEEYDEKETKYTTTTTVKPSFRRRQPKPVSTTQAPDEVEEPELPKLRLITRFRSTPAPIKETERQDTTKNPPPKEYDDDIEVTAPKYREKKKKTSKSTLVTDTKTYGDDKPDHEMMKDEVDAMIGVQHDMKDYTPRYEKEIEEKSSIRKRPDSSESSEDSEEDEEDDDEISDEDEDTSDEDDESDEKTEENSSALTSSEEKKTEVTTPEPTKRTLVRTTEAPISTTESRSAKLELKPIIHKKKIEIHKEIPVNKSSPHVTQFKEDIKEYEVIKEMPPKRRIPQRVPQKNIEALELYKDDNLAKEINKLGAVEVFKENLDLNKGPRHGGNYKSAKIFEMQQPKPTSQPQRNENLKAKDTDASQSENAKLVDLIETLPARRRINSRGRNVEKSAKLELADTSDEVPKKLHGGNLRSRKNDEDSRESARNAKLIELDEQEDNPRGRNVEKSAKLELADTSDEVPKKLHGGNLRSRKNDEDSRESARNAKLIELDEQEDDDDESSEMHGGNFKTYDNSRSYGRSLHGGNYRSAKLVQKDDKDEDLSKKQKEETVVSPRSKATSLLSSLIQAAPHITTTPVYILDPSKRKYYYVDT